MTMTVMVRVEIIISSGDDDELTEAMMVRGRRLMGTWAMTLQGQSFHPFHSFQGKSTIKIRQGEG